MEKENEKEKTKEERGRGEAELMTVRVGLLCVYFCKKKKVCTRNVASSEEDLEKIYSVHGPLGSNSVTPSPSHPTHNTAPHR